MEEIFYLLFAIVGIVTGWILRGRMDRGTDGRDGVISFSSLDDNDSTERTITEITETIEQAKRNNEAATETIKKMQDLLHSVRNDDNNTGNSGISFS